MPCCTRMREPGAAHLALVGIDSADRMIDCHVEIGHSGGDDLRRLATGLHRHALEVRFARVDHHELADIGRAGEADLVHVHVESERLAYPAAGAVHHVEHTGWPTGLDEQLRKQGRRQRRELRRLQHDRVAGSQGGRNLPRIHQQRIVPRRDAADDAERLAQDVMEHIRRGAGDDAFYLIDCLCKVTKRQGRGGHIAGHHVHDGLAHIERIQQPKFQPVVVDLRREAVQHVHPCPWFQARPHTGAECPSRGADRAVHVVGVARWHAGDHLARGRVDRFEPLARRRVVQLAIDEHPGLRPQRAGVAAEVLDGQQSCLIDMHCVTRYRSSTTSVPRRGTEQQSSTSPAERGATGSST